MGDRATIAFIAAPGNEVARVYVHNGGSVVDKRLDEFFSVETDLAQTHQHDLRWHDPSMLAARFVAWCSQPSGLGVGVVGPDWTERQHWEVLCSNPDSPEGRCVEPGVRRVMPQIDTTNDFLFGINGHGVIAPTLPVGPMDRAKALRAAAWLAVIADPGGEEFEAVLEAVKST